MLLTLLFYIFLFVVVLQLVFYILLFGKFSFSKAIKTKPSNQLVSIIIAAKNEAQNLKNNLPYILNQDYPNFEIIIVNDASTDDSLTILTEFRQHHKNLTIVNLAVTDFYKGNKKNAISNGVEAASNEYLLFTDADCKPNSKNWISEMTVHFTNIKSIVLGYGGYQKINNSFLNKLIRYETLLTAIQYFSYAKLGLPYMGVGRNLAYKKELFSHANGFESHKHITSGDDDLFINEIAMKQNVAVSFSKESFTISNSKTDFKSWFQQKRRHISTAANYKPIHQFLLGLFFCTQFLFWTLAIILLILAFKWQIVTILIVIRLITQYIVVQSSADKLDEKSLVIFTPLLDVILVFTQLILFFTNIISKPKHW